MISRVSLILVATFGVLGIALAQGRVPAHRRAARDGGVVADGGRRDAGRRVRRKRRRVRRPARDGGEGAGTEAGAGTDGGAEADGGVPRTLAARVADLETRVTALEQAQATMQTALDQANERIAELEQAQGETAARRRARTPRFNRVALLGGILQDLEGAEHDLSEGNTDGVQTTVNRDITALGEVSAEARRLGRILEAEHADAASQLLGDAIDALGQSDLYRTRVLIAEAMLRARRAQALAQTVTGGP